MRRLIKKANVKRVALCRRGVNMLQTLYKGEGGALLNALVKSTADFDDRGELLAVVAAPGLEDSEGDSFADPDVIRASMHAFMRAGAELDIEHDGAALSRDRAHVAEVFTIQKSDERFRDWKTYGGRPVDVTGGWGMLIKVGDPALRKAYREGAWDGVSLFAPGAELQLLAKSAAPPAGVRTELMKALLDAGLIDRNPDDGDPDVTPDELKAALAESNTTLVKALGDLLKPAASPAPAAPAAPSATIEFVGDPMNVEHLKVHQAKLVKAELIKSGALNDPAKLAEHLALLAGPAPVAGESAEVVALRAALAKAERASRQVVGPDGKPAPAAPASTHPFVTSGLMKAEGADEIIKNARAAAALINAQRFGPAKV